MKNDINDISSAFRFPNLATIILDMNSISRTIVLRSVNYKDKVIFGRVEIHIEWIDYI